MPQLAYTTQENVCHSSLEQCACCGVIQTSDRFIYDQDNDPLCQSCEHERREATR